MIELGILYLWYRMVMWLVSRKTQIRSKSKIIYYFAVLLGVIGYLGDVIVNATYGSLVFLELPKELTLSTRLKRIRRTQDTGSWRYLLADFVCERIINPHDPTGEHC